MMINGFVLPDPDDIGMSEYRIVHNMLDDSLEELSGDAAAQQAIDLMYGVQEWCIDLIAKLQATIGKEVSDE